MSDYTFDPAFARDHFIGKYIAYASRQTDAAHEYHEAIGLVLLSMVTPDIRARLRPFPKGLRTNLYVALIGSTSKSRKSTAKDIGVDILTRVLPEVLLSSKSTPEAFAEQLESRPHQSSLWAVDEFAALMVQLQRRDYLAGLVDILLELYNGVDEYRYVRTKRPVHIQAPHLSVIGCAADTVFESLHTHDVESGLLPRFAVVMPEDKPKRLPFYATGDDDTAARNELVRELAALCPKRDDEGRVTEARNACFQPQALEVIDNYAEEHEEHYNGAMFRRLMPMVLKVSLLSAIGAWHLTTMGRDIVVTSADAHAALKVIKRWTEFAEAFVQRLGESRMEILVRRASEFMSQGAPHVARRDVARYLRLDARLLADVEKTLVDRELIRVGDFKEHAAGPAIRCWQWLGGNRVSETG
jgi:hypothetical protein